MRTEFTPEQLLARAALIERQIETWKGRPDYAETLRMESWALRLAAGMIVCGRDGPDGTIIVRAMQVGGKKTDT